MAKTKTIELYYAYSEDCPHGENFEYLTFKVHKEHLKDIIITSISASFPVHEKEIKITESQIDRALNKTGLIIKLRNEIKEELGFSDESN